MGSTDLFPSRQARHNTVTETRLLRQFVVVACLFQPELHQMDEIFQ